METLTALTPTSERRKAIIAKYNLHFYPPVIFWNPQPPTDTAAEWMQPLPRPNIKTRDLADWRGMVYGLPAMTAKVREWLRHKLFTFQFMFQRPCDYTVVDSVRPIPEGMTEARTSALFATTSDWGSNIYFLYGRKRRLRCDDPDETLAMERDERCMDRKMRYPLQYAPFTDSIPYRNPWYFPTVLERYRVPVESGGTWGETKGGSQTWKAINSKGRPTRRRKPDWVKALKARKI
jgi:hypothetical protein